MGATVATVLIVDDDTNQRRAYARQLRGYHILEAASSKEARGVFLLHQTEIDVIVLDGELAGSDTTLELPGFFRESGFSSTMIAASGRGDLCEELRVRGCNYRIKNSKAEVVPLIKELFPL